jgi:hypothetical protein
MWIAADNAHWTKCSVQDSETNRLEVMQVARLIADRYGFQDRTDEKRARDEQSDFSLQASGYTIIAHYYAAGSDKPSSDIDLDVLAFKGEVKASLYQRKWGKATKKYAEIRDRFISEFKGHFGAEVDVRIADYKIH